MPEKIETINQFLADNYGIDTDDRQPIYRVVWSDDQYEKRLSHHTASGTPLLTPEVMELPKYGYIRHVYILEQRVIVPEQNIHEMAGAKKSYEPLWVFEGKDGNPVPPTIQGAKFVVDTVLAAMGKKSLAKYKDPYEGATPQESYELNKQRVDRLQEELFGDESSLGGETFNESGSAIIVPGRNNKIN